VGAALTAVDMGGALAELRKLGAEKIAEENEAKNSPKMGVKKLSVSETGEVKEGPEEMVSTTPISKEQFQGYTPEERMRVKEMLKKLRSEAKLRS
jgi:hypothetical protein